MDELTLDHLVLRYCRQVIMQVMDHVRSRMREENLPALKQQVHNVHIEKSELNPTKAIDQEAEDLIVEALRSKFVKLPGVKAYTVFSEELGIRTFPDGASEADADLVVFVDPIDGTEFVEALQGGWSLIAVYDRRENDVIATVAGDIFLDRIYWASRSGYAECLDFITHSWFRLDGGAQPKSSLAGARVNVLTTKVDRYRALSEQTALMDAIREQDGRVNLSWGSNTIIQVAAGYADVAIEFAKGFATYDILSGLYIGLKTGLTILDLNGNPITSKLDLDEIFAAFRKDARHPKRTPFVAAKNPALAEQVIRLLKKHKFPGSGKLPNPGLQLIDLSGHDARARPGGEGLMTNSTEGKNCNIAAPAREATFEDAEGFVRALYVGVVEFGTVLSGEPNSCPRAGINRERIAIRASFKRDLIRHHNG
ncbi:MAG TPA: inositol monophosphatase family protein [Terriglobales bacterium]|jgi:fructose-1,6-bisphosphatase/inositol monophosphatase family enzyme